MRTIYGTIKDLKRYVKQSYDYNERRWEYTSESVLLRSYKTDLPLGAWTPDRSTGGQFYSRRNILDRYSPSHQYGGSMDAYNILLFSVQKSAEKKLKGIKK